MLRPSTKALTINRLPTELVDFIKHLAVDNDCTIPEVVEVLLTVGIKTTKSTLYADIHDLRLKKRKDRAEAKKAKEERQKLQSKLDKEVLSNDSAS